MKKTLLAILAVLALCACQEKKMDRFEREAREYTAKHCPERVDEVTRMDSIVFDSHGTGTLLMYYTLMLDSAQMELLNDVVDDIDTENLSKVRNAVTFIKYREAGVKFSYIYRSGSDGSELLRLDYDSSRY